LDGSGNLTTTGTVTAPTFIGNVTGNISGTAANVTGTVAVANGGTGAATAPAALTALGAYPSANPANYQTGAQVDAAIAAKLATWNP